MTTEEKIDQIHKMLMAAFWNAPSPISDSELKHLKEHSKPFVIAPKSFDELYPFLNCAVAVREHGDFRRLEGHLSADWFTQTIEVIPFKNSHKRKVINWWDIASINEIEAPRDQITKDYDGDGRVWTLAGHPGLPESEVDE